ncbi:TrmH family RNA methyltransferase [Dokdonia sp. Hel_I_53]|uniref:TrmH family RNA methyltransferase n=1 Tax=Dokdonia sp. Hel_I_53 TaxID=1566287 RepID=UPI00119C1007|nr:RNA methyltransferase [Dokdonia sp. Hel_I_53]TVZ53210.1 TrmH family RNA methyltransferase [Dokdonia sp. Hel_I_53]
MVSKNTIKRITSLGQKKYRNREGIFVAEGIKVITELLQSTFLLKELYVEDENAFAKAITKKEASKIFKATHTELKKLSFLKTPQKAVAVFNIPKESIIDRGGITVVIDDVRDPGNLGTIIRLCDWFGIKQLICSPQTVDCFNPKVVQATMGSLTRVHIIYTNLEEYLKEEHRTIYGTFMDGTNIYQCTLEKEGVLIMGNEANGISSTIEHYINSRIAIPRFGVQQATESLNVATAAAISLSEFKR